MANYIVDYQVNVTGNVDLVAKQAASINQNMKQAAVAAGGIPRAAQAALSTTGRGIVGSGAENREYGAARGSMGATGASSRDFAKQAEGLGGLVRLYATFAANIFAASMAFEAFKRSFAFEQLQQASDAFAITTGKNLSGVAAELKKLADGALTDKAAQQMANYGSSAGFTAEQMRRTIVVARGASQALGRDMGDAVDRLMRGMGKLEPELLDELGLLTRTKAAGTEYAKSVGKTFETLTQFEKTQAFANAVLKEGEDKFLAVAKAVQISPFEKFSTALLNVGTMLANVINKGLVPLLKFFSDNPGAMVTALGLAFAKLLTTALPALTKIGDAAKESAETQKKAFESIKAKAVEAQAGILGSERNRIKETMKLRREDSLDLRESILKDIKVRNQLLGDVAGSRAGFVQALRANPNASIPLEDLQKTANRAQGMIAAGKNVEANTKLLALAQQQAKVEIERINIQEQRLGIVKEEIELRNKLRSMVSAENIPTTRGFATQQAKAELDSFKATQLAAVASTAQAYGMRRAFGQLGETIVQVGQKHRELYEGISRTNIGATISRSFSQLGTVVSGTFSIMTAGVSNFLNVAGPWIAIIGLAVAGFQLLISVTGGVNEKLTALQDAQETFAKSLKLTGDQAVRFTALQLAVDGTAESFLKLKTYSANVFTGIVDGLETTTSAFAAFVANSGGWWSTIKEGVKSWFNADAVTEQVSQLRTSIYTVLGTTSAGDVQKVQTAILKALPTAASIDDVISKLGTLSSSQLADFGKQLSANLASVNIQLKASEDNLKNAIGGWTSLGAAIDKYNDKNEVKDPKLKGVVDALEVINAAYRSANTDKDRALAISKLDTELQDKLVKLMKERGLATQELVKWLEEARKSAANYAAEERQAALDRKKEQEIKALSYIAENDFLEKQQQLEAVMTRLRENKYDRSTVTGGMEAVQDEKLFEKLKIQLPKVLDSAIKSAKEAEDSISVSTLTGFKSGLTASLDSFSDIINERIEGWARNAKEAVIRGVSTITGFGNIADLAVKDNNKSSAVQIAAEVRSFRQSEAASQGPGKPVVTELEKTTALMKQLEAIGKHHEKIAKFWEFEVGAAAAHEAQIKRIADIEKETLGYIEEETSAQQLLAGINRADAELGKRMADLDKEYNQNKAKNSEDAWQNYIKGIEAAVEINVTTRESLDLESLRSVLLREKVQLEKLVIEPMKLQLSISNQILDIKKNINSISDINFNIAKAENQAQSEKLDILAKENSLKQKIALYANTKGISEAEASQRSVFAMESNLLNIEKQRIELSKTINIQVAKYNEYIESAARTEKLITENLTLQATALEVMSTEAERADQVQRASQSFITAAAKEYLDVTRNLTDEKDKQIALSNAVLKVENQILEIKRAQYEANARDPRADIGKTIQQGLEIAYQDATRKAIGYGKSLVDGLTNGINDAVDLFFNKIAAGQKMTFKEISTAFSAAFKKAIFDGFASQVKKMFAGLFAEGGKSDTIQLKEQIQKEIEAQNKQLSKIEDNITALQNLTSEIRKLETTIARQAQKTVIYDDEYERSIQASTQAIDGLSEAGKRYNDVVDAEDMAMGALMTTSFAASDAQLQLAQSSLVASESLGTLPGLLGQLAGLFGISASSPIGKALGALQKGMNIFSSGSKLVSGAEKLAGIFSGSGGASIAGSSAALELSLPLSSAPALAAEALAGATPAITTFAQGLGSLTSTLTAAMPYIGAATAAYMVYKTFFKKTTRYEGTGSAGNVPSGNTIANQKGNNKAEYNEQSEAAAKAALSNYSILLSKLGGKTTAGDAGFATGVSTRKGKQSTVAAESFIGGKEVYSSHKDVGKNLSGEELAKALELETNRAVFAALKASDLPKNVAAYFAEVADEAISSLSQEEIATKLDFGSVLGEISKNRALVAQTFGEDLYNLTEQDLKAFQIGTETLSETFVRLGTLFTATDKITKLLGIDTVKAFGAVGLASGKARQKMVDAAGGLDKFTEKMTYFTEHFFTEAERGSNAFYQSTLLLKSGFAEMGIAIPASMEAYKQAMNDAIISGNYDLVNSLLDMAPAFDTVIGAIERVTATVDQLIEKSIDDILESTMTTEQKYTKYAGRAETGSAKLDKYMGMTDTELLAEIKAGRLSPADVEKIATGVIENVNTAIGFIPTEERAAYQTQWVGFLTDFGSNVTKFNERIAALTTANDVVPADGNKKLPEDPSRKTALSASSAEDIGNTIDTSFTTGASKVAEAIVNGFATAAANMATPRFEGLESTTDLGSISNTMATTLDTIAANGNATQQAIFDQQVATMNALADKLLGAADGMLAASVGLQTAANTPKVVHVSIDAPAGVSAAQQESEVNR